MMVPMTQFQLPNEHFVFHGSPEFFEIAQPSRHIRSRQQDGSELIVFDEISYHATPYRWIASAYMCGRKGCQIDDKSVLYNMGVSLYNREPKVTIYGFESLEARLKTLYGDGGWLYYFRKEDFFHKKGLGNHEVMTNVAMPPWCTERIDNPLTELRAAEVEFEFVDLALHRNEHLRSYV